MKHKEFEANLAKRNDTFKKRLRKRATPSEKIVGDIFKSVKLKHSFQKGFYKLSGKHKGYHCIVDFYIPSLRLAIEIDGEYHNSPEQKAKDEFKDKWIAKKRKANVLRVKNEEADNIMEIIDSFIHRSKRRKHINLKYWEEKYSY